MTTIQKGEVAFLKCSLRAIELNIIMSKPTTDARYDAVLDHRGHLQRAQIKYCDRKPSKSSGSVELRLERHGKTYSATEIDVVLVYMPMVDRILYLPTKYFDGKKTITLRHTAPANGQTHGVQLASRFFW